MKRIVLFTLMVLVSFYAKAQLYSSEACFYVRAGVDMSDEGQEYCYVYYFDGNNLYQYATSLSIMKDILRKNPNHFENGKNMYTNPYIYDKSRTTNSYHVYTQHHPEKTINMFTHFVHYPENFECVAVSKDKSSIITWTEEKGEIHSKISYVRIDKDQLLPKAINRDFLYE